MNDWTIYMLRCRNNALYTGITKNLAARLQAHNNGTGAKYTRANGPCELVWSRDNLSESDAKKEEARMKKLSKAEKEAFLRAI